MLIAVPQMGQVQEEDVRPAEEPSHAERHDHPRRTLLLEGDGDGSEPRQVERPIVNQVNHNHHGVW